MNTQRKIDTDLYKDFSHLTIMQLQEKIHVATKREEKIFYSKLLSLKMALSQEKVIGKELL